MRKNSGTKPHAHSQPVFIIAACSGDGAPDGKAGMAGLSPSRLTR